MIADGGLPTSAVSDAARPPALPALAADIKLSHTVFALPYALLASFMARSADDGGSSWVSFVFKLVIVVGCMVAARTAAMLANRLLDREIDARNPRTMKRALPSGRVAVRDAVVLLLWSAGIFVGLCTVFGFAFDNWWPLLLSLPVLGWICIYPLLKRITWLCHLHLGSSLALSPIAASLAIAPESLGNVPEIWLLSLAVLCWVAGFDIIYALQDIAIDRSQNLHSIPGRLGVRTALWISRALHAGSVGLLGALVIMDNELTQLFGLGVGLAALLLGIEHVLTARGNTDRIGLAFLTLNGVVSVIVGGLGIACILTAR